MQGQRSTVESFPETFEFDHGPSSSSSIVDQQVYWNPMLNPVDTRNLPEYLLSPTDTNMSYVNVVSRDSVSLNGWNFGGPSSSEHALGQTSHDEAKMEENWTSSLPSNAVAGPRSEERQFEAANMLSLENVDINLNTDQSVNEQLFLQNSNANDAPQTSNHNAGFVGNSHHVSESGIRHLYNPCSSEAEQIQSAGGPSSSSGTSAGGVGYLSEDGDGRPGGPLDGRRLSCKRKTIEGVPGPSSVNGSPSCFQRSENSLFNVVSAQHNSASSLNMSSSSDNLSGANPSEEQLNPRFGTALRGSTPECHISVSLAGNAASSQRNFRMRVNPAHQHDSSPNLLLSGNSIRRSNSWSPNQPSSPLLIPFNQLQEARPVVASTSSQSQSHVPPIPVMPRNVHPFLTNGASNSSNSRITSSSVISGERSAILREETNPRSIPRNNIPEHPMFVPTTDVRHLAQDPTNWSLSNGNISIPGNTASTSRVGSSSAVHPSSTPTWVPHQNPPTRHPLSFSGFTRRSFFPSAGSDSGGHSNNLLPQHSVHSASLHEMIPQHGTGLRGHQQSFLRPAFLMDRQNDGALGVPLSLRNLAAAREGRSRVISEIRNALELMRRGENIRIEDVLILDQSVFFGGADLHDRHRDMRLDVDNMSYEELLALEERIGNVSTGLCEEKILKCLKQRKYFSVTVEASMEVEPCCICQEEYVEGQDLGKLDCGHDFHTVCIKQWLMHKNLCPVCKTTALVS